MIPTFEMTVPVALAIQAGAVPMSWAATYPGFGFDLLALAPLTWAIAGLAAVRYFSRRPERPVESASRQGPERESLRDAA
jgi:hypothetical protein